MASRSRCGKGIVSKSDVHFQCYGVNVNIADRIKASQKQTI